MDYCAGTELWRNLLFYFQSLIPYLQKTSNISILDIIQLIINIFKGLKITNFANNKLNLAVKELFYEKKKALEVCRPHCVCLMTDSKT